MNLVFNILFSCFLIFNIIKVSASTELVESSNNSENENSLKDHFRLATFREIIKDLSLPKVSKDDESKFPDTISNILNSSHLKRNIFKRNCEKYDSSILIELLNVDDFPLIDDILTPKCIERILDTDNISILELHDKMSLKYFNSIFENEKCLGEFLNDFLKDPSAFFKVLSAKTCDQILILCESSSCTPERLGQVLTCLYKFPTNSKLVNALISLKKISSNDFFTEDNKLPLPFLNDSLNSIKENRPDDLINILTNWKMIIEFILKQEWNENDSNRFFFYFQPAYSLKSTIFHQDYIYKDLDLVAKFKTFPPEKILEIQTILNEIFKLIPVSKDGDYHKNSGLIRDLTTFMNPHSPISSIKSKELEQIFENDMESFFSLIIYMIKFNPESIDRLLTKNNLNPEKLVNSLKFLYKNFSNFLDYPIKSEFLIVCLAFSYMKPYFNTDNKKETMNRILNFANSLELLSWFEVNITVILKLLLQVSPDLNQENRERINFLLQKWFQSIQSQSNISTLESLLKLLKTDSQFDWISLSSLSNPSNTKIDQNQKEMSNNIKRFFILQVRRLRALFSLWKGHDLDPRNGKIVPESPDDLALYIETPERLAQKLYFDENTINEIKEKIPNYSEIEIASESVLKLLLPRKTIDQVGSSSFPRIVSYIGASEISSDNQNIDSNFRKNMLASMIFFKILYSKSIVSWFRFNFQGGQVGYAPNGEYLYAMIKAIFIHTDEFRFISDSNGIKLPALLVHGHIMLVLGTMIGQLIAYHNTVPEISFDDAIWDYIHDLSMENLEKAWKRYCQLDLIMIELNKMLETDQDITDKIFNFPIQRLTFTIIEPDKITKEITLKHSNWDSMFDDSFPKFSTNQEAREFLRDRIEFFKCNFYDGLIALRYGLSRFIDMNMIRNQNMTFSKLFKSKMPSREEFIELIDFNSSIELHEPTLDSLVIDRDGNRIPGKVSIKDGIIDFIKEAKEKDYERLLKIWLISSKAINLKIMKPKVAIRPVDIPNPYLTEEYFEYLSRSGYDLRNPPLSTDNQQTLLSDDSLKRETLPRTQTCNSLLLIPRYKTIDELRAALLFLANSSETFLKGE